VTSLCEFGNELLGSIKADHFLTSLVLINFSRKILEPIVRWFVREVHFGDVS